MIEWMVRAFSFSKRALPNLERIFLSHFSFILLFSSLFPISHHPFWFDFLSHFDHVRHSHSYAYSYIRRDIPKRKFIHIVWRNEFPLLSFEVAWRFYRFSPMNGRWKSVTPRSKFEQQNHFDPRWFNCIRNWFALKWRKVNTHKKLHNFHVGESASLKFDLPRKNFISLMGKAFEKCILW